MSAAASTPDGRLVFWRKMAHRATFQYVSGKERRTRRAFFEWLAEQMGIPHEQARIRLMDVDQCKKVIRICKEAKRHEQVQKV